MGEYKTPGVYIKEKNAFPNSVVEAATAIPAFIGYTQQAKNGNNDLKDIPWKISSMTEYIKYFGGAPEVEFKADIIKYHPDAKKNNDGKATPEGAMLKPESKVFQYDVKSDEKDKFKVENKDEDYDVNYALCIDGESKYTLYYNMMLFFANGGGTCYIVSVGNYNDELNKEILIKALEALKLEQEITMVVIPEAVNLDGSSFKDVQTQMLSHCGYTMKNRFALLDIYPKADKNTPIEKQVEVFWDGIGSNFLSYGATYFPWLNTSVLGDRDLDGNMFAWTDNIFTNRNKFSEVDSAFSEIVEAFYSDEIELTKNKEGEDKKVVNTYTFELGKVEIGEIKIETNIIGEIVEVTIIEGDEANPVTQNIKVVWKPDSIDKQALHQALFNGSYIYKQAMKGVLKSLNLLPPSAAMAGIYTMVDNNRGVWKAPANVTLSYVDSTTEDIDDEQQADLNAPMNGKSVNVLRLFRGEGIKVWGARTLDGNSLDWRYVNVRRTLLFLEESVKNAARAYVFEPNDASTWINMKCMIENFLRSVWKRGGLAGASPEDAYEVHVGLGDTMTAEDILEGIMRITVLVAVTHPAEFIEITFQQQMQKS